ASHDARGSHCGAFRDDILVKSLWLGAKRQPDAELPRARADGKCEHACDTDYRNRQCDRRDHAKHHRIQTTRTEHLSAAILARTVQDWIGPEHVLIDGGLTGEDSLREGLADDGDGFFVLNVEFVEIATRNDGNAQRRKEPGRDNTKLRAGVVFARGLNVTVGAELQAGTRTGIAPGSDHPEGGLIDTWKGINATYDFLVKIDNLLACLSIKDGGDVDGKDVARVHAGL